MSHTFYDDAVLAAPKPGMAVYAAGGKRLVDLVLVVAMLPIVLPILALAWALTAREGGGGFYSQPRIGRDGRVFRCWKIRTMVSDADAELARLMAADPGIATEWRTTQKLRNDPRVTRAGQLLRRTSIDELPQLWNVVMGEMSLIGPRPFTPNQKAMYDKSPDSAAYYTLRPGISGLWQVDRRNSGGFDERAPYDALYARSLSLGHDLRIIGRTLGAVCCATGN
ncbi:MAG: sugar transferase [Paracoccaceae bacterium]